MRSLNLQLWTCDVGAPAIDAMAYARHIIDRVQRSWDDGADLVVFPEYSWMGLERFIAGDDKLAGVAELFWSEIWPGVVESLSRPDKAVVLGTVPAADGDGKFRNRAPILSGGRIEYQDKLHLTPWEDTFSAGEHVRIWEFMGMRCAVVICLDVEIPELSAALRGCEVDLILVPSATESVLGVERVGRCASARAIELGCMVGLCHLVGATTSVLVDENVGRLALFAPSQSPFLPEPRERVGGLITRDFHSLSATIDPTRIRAARSLLAETNPVNIAVRGLTVAAD